MSEPDFMDFIRLRLISWLQQNQFFRTAAEGTGAYGKFQFNGNDSVFQRSASGHVQGAVSADIAGCSLLVNGNGFAILCYLEDDVITFFI